MGWLGWDEARFDAWLNAWHYDLTMENTWLYHEDEFYWILPLMVPDDLAERLRRQRTKQIYNDLAQLMYIELDEAIQGRPKCYPIGVPGFDWDEAKSRAVKVLQSYGRNFPGRDEITSYERHILSRPSDWIVQYQRIQEKEETP